MTAWQDALTSGTVPGAQAIAAALPRASIAELDSGLTALARVPASLAPNSQGIAVVSHELLPEENGSVITTDIAIRTQPRGTPLADGNFQITTSEPWLTAELSPLGTSEARIRLSADTSPIRNQPGPFPVMVHMVDLNNVFEPFDLRFELFREVFDPGFHPGMVRVVERESTPVQAFQVKPGHRVRFT